MRMRILIKTKMASTRKRGRPSALSWSGRKRRKIAYETERQKSKVYIGDHIDRWNELKGEENLRFHHEVAGFLLDLYDHYGKSGVGHAGLSVKTALTSTPGSTAKPLSSEALPVSEISSEESTPSGSGMSGVQELAKPLPSTSSGRHVKGIDRSSSFINPFDLTLDVSEEFEDDTDVEDEDYEPSFHITIGPTGANNIEDVAAAEMVLGNWTDTEESEDEVEEDKPYGGGGDGGITRILDINNSQHLLNDETALVFISQLKVLANKKIESHCKVKGCGKQLEISTESLGTAIYLKWVCGNGHLFYKWCSQPLLNRGLHSGDLMTAAAILFSGNNFSKVDLLAKFLKLHFLGSSSFTRIQRTYLVPSIEELWEEQQEQCLSEFRGSDITVLGDGRMDSPGHSAQYCSYTMMENTTKKILSIATLDKRQTDRKSANLEKAGFLKTMDELKRKGITVTEVVTDAHMQIQSIMKKQFSDMKHSHDIWHAAKNLGKKIVTAGQDKLCKPLLKWNRDIINHFWHCCEAANTYDDFIGLWAGVIHHVVNEHEWVLPYSDVGPSECSHGPLSDTEEKEWLEKGSPAHVALRKIVLNKRLLDSIPYFLNFRSTAELENFQNHILMYAAKRFAYTPPVYRARNLLAVMDYNENVTKGVMKNKDGTTRFQRTYNKKSGRWSVVTVKEKKTYNHVFILLGIVVNKRLQDVHGMHRKVVLAEDDPRKIAPNIAPVPPPPTAELVEQKKSRLSKQLKPDQ